jgi:hypothetical protein
MSHPRGGRRWHLSEQKSLLPTKILLSFLGKYNKRSRREEPKREREREPSPSQHLKWRYKKRMMLTKCSQNWLKRGGGGKGREKNNKATMAEIQIFQIELSNTKTQLMW